MAARRQARVWDWLYAAQSWLAMEDASGLNRKALVVGPLFALRCRRPKSQLRWSTAARWINETAAAESRMPRFLGGCSPAEPASASPTALSIHCGLSAGNDLSANGNLSLVSES